MICLIMALYIKVLHDIVWTTNPMVVIAIAKVLLTNQKYSLHLYQSGWCHG